jgi:hypothetical protein
LGQASRLQAGAKLGHVPNLPVGSPHQAPDQRRHHADGEQYTYKEKGEQEFE